MKQENKTCFLMTGLSAAGKTSIVYKLIEDNKELEKVITSTSRSIRPGEENGKDYYFYDKSEFENMIENNELFENAEVYGNLYGSEKKEVRRIFDSGHIPLFVCDVQGLATLSETVPNIKTIYVLPDSFENLKKRIEKRPGLTTETTLKRLLEAEKELEYVKLADYCIINEEGRLDNAVADFSEIVNINIEKVDSKIDKELSKFKSSNENIQYLIKELLIGINRFKKENQEFDNEIKVK